MADRSATIVFMRTESLRLSQNSAAANDRTRTMDSIGLRRVESCRNALFPIHEMGTTRRKVYMALDPMPHPKPAVADPAGRRWRRLLMRWLFLFLVGYVGLVLLVVCFQRKLIYFPTRFSAALAAELAIREGFQAWLNGEGQVVGWCLPAVGQATGAVLIAHGNAGAAL